MKDQALEAVKLDLNNPDALPNALASLRMLFGRPELVYQALIKQVRTAPVLKMEKLETIVTFVMRIKTLCDTLTAAGMKDYLVNPPLLTELVKRLSNALRLRWGDHIDIIREHVKINLSEFSGWMQREIEKISRVLGQLCVSDTPRNSHVPKSTKEKNPIIFKELIN